MRALAIYEKVGSPEHPAVATVLNTLGQVAKVQDRYAVAEPLIKRSLAVRERAVGPDHPDTARSLNNLAAFYAVTGYPEPLPLALRLIASGRGELRAVLPVLADAERNQLIATEPAVDASPCGGDASETSVKRAPLSDYSIVYFATNGPMAGDVKGIAEPCLR